MLASKYWRIIIDHYRDAVVIQRKRCDFDISRGFTIEQWFLNFKEITKSILLLCTSSLQHFHKFNGASIHYRTFRPIELNSNIVNL